MAAVVFKRDDPKLFEKIKQLNAKYPLFVTPTDTVYGLGAVTQDPQGAIRLSTLKGKTDFSYIVLVRNLTEAEECGEWSSSQLAIAKRYWPGMITFIVNKKKSKETIAIRHPNSPFLLSLMDQFNGPIFSTSCNQHGQPPVSSIEEALTLFGTRVDFFVDGGALPMNSPSTLIDLTETPARVVRQGAVKFG